MKMANRQCHLDNNGINNFMELALAQKVLLLISTLYFSIFLNYCNLLGLHKATSLDALNHN